MGRHGEPEAGHGDGAAGVRVRGGRKGLGAGCAGAADAVAEPVDRAPTGAERAGSVCTQFWIRRRGVAGVVEGVGSRSGAWGRLNGKCVGSMVGFLVELVGQVSEGEYEVDTALYKCGGDGSAEGYHDGRRDKLQCVVGYQGICG